MPHGASSRQAVASLSRSATLSPGRRMNSQRRRPGPPDTTVVGRRGSQSCQLIGVHTRRSRGTTSTMSQSKKKPRSVTALPRCRRTKLLAPSQPTTQRAPISRRSPSGLATTSATCHLPARMSTTSRARCTATDGQGVHPRIERPLELGLREHVGFRPARESRVLASDDEERLAGGVPLLVGIGLGQERQLLPEAGGLQDAGDLVVEVDCPGQRIRHGLLLEYADLPAPLPKQKTAYEMRT